MGKRWHCTTSAYIFLIKTNGENLDSREREVDYGCLREKLWMSMYREEKKIRAVTFENHVPITEK